MGFASLAVVMLAALLGPFLAVASRWMVPVVVGEVLVGVALGGTGLGYLDPADDRFAFLAEIGFALVMFVAGAHVPVRDRRLLRSCGSVVAARRWPGSSPRSSPSSSPGRSAPGTPPCTPWSWRRPPRRWCSRSCRGSGSSGEPVVELVAQVAVADIACIVALPFAIDPGRAGPAALGALLVLAAGAVAIGLLYLLERSGVRRKVHHLSERRKFALELRISLLVLFALAAVATWSRVSVLLAGFVLGLGVAAVGEPRRLARQLFAVTEGFFSPVFFVWLGTSLDLRALGAHPAARPPGSGTRPRRGAAATRWAGSRGSRCPWPSWPRASSASPSPRPPWACSCTSWRPGSRPRSCSAR